MSERLGLQAAEATERRKNDPVFAWLNQSSDVLWQTVKRIADLFPSALKRTQTNNPLWGIIRFLFIFVAGFVLVTPLYLIFAPAIQIVLVVAALAVALLRGIWQSLRQVTGLHRV